MPNTLKSRIRLHSHRLLLAVFTSILPVQLLSCWEFPSPSAPVVNNIMPSDTIPVANAGGTIYCKTGDIVTLDGSKSTVSSGSTIYYNWKPSSLNPAAVSLSSIAHPSFIPSIVGVYTFQLRVSDGVRTSEAADVEVIVSNNFLSVRKGLSDTDYSRIDSLQGRPLYYSTVETAVRSAHRGDTILVYEGLYSEKCTRFVSGIVLLGKDRFQSIIDGGGRSFDSLGSLNPDSVGSTLFLDSVSNITIANLTIRRGGRSQRPNDQDVANISCHICSNINIVNNEIINSGNDADGIRLSGSFSIGIIGNHIANNYCSGIRNSNSHIRVNSNVIADNGSSIGIDTIGSYSGISIECDTPFCAGLQIDIYGNEFHDNRTNNIKMWSPSNANIVGNTFTRSGGGIYYTSVNNLTLDRNSFGAFLPPPIKDTIYAIIEKNISDTITAQIIWADKKGSCGPIVLSSGDSGIVVVLPHDKPDSYPLTITTNGTLMNVQQYLGEDHPYQWFDTLRYIHAFVKL